MFLILYPPLSALCFSSFTTRAQCDQSSLHRARKLAQHTLSITSSSPVYFHILIPLSIFNVVPLHVAVTKSSVSAAYANVGGAGGKMLLFTNLNRLLLFPNAPHSQYFSCASIKYCNAFALSPNSKWKYAANSQAKASSLMN